jgi:hypothetical protein
MSAMIEKMAAEANARLAQRLNRSAGQHSRRVRASFAEIMPVIPIVKREPGAIDFIGSEPEPPSMSIFRSLMFAVELVLGAWFVAIVCGWIYGKYFGV